MTPDSALQLQKLGYDCAIESGAGSLAGFSDKAYSDAGVEIKKTAAALWKDVDVVAKVREPDDGEPTGPAGRNTGIANHECPI